MNTRIHRDHSPEHVVHSLRDTAMWMRKAQAQLGTMGDTIGISTIDEEVLEQAAELIEELGHKRAGRTLPIIFE